MPTNVAEAAAPIALERKSRLLSAIEGDECMSPSLLKKWLCRTHGVRLTLCVTQSDRGPMPPDNLSNLEVIKI
jgi:hypothetical protein